MKEKDKYVQNLQGTLEKEQKLIVELQVKQNENNEVLAQLQIVRQKINNMEKHNKDLRKNQSKKGLFANNFDRYGCQILKV